MAATLITGFGCIVDSVVVSDMDNEDVLLLLVCVGVEKAEAEEIKASARMIDSFMIAIYCIGGDEYYGTKVATIIMSIYKFD